MKRLNGCLALAALLCAAPLFAQSKAKAENVPEIPYEATTNLLKFPPGLYMGEGIGVATNSKGHIFVYTRSGDTRLFEFDEKGTYIREIGQGLYGFSFAHAVRIDPQDNIWAVDEGTNMVVKFNPEGKVVMTLGRKPPAADQLALMPGNGGFSGANKPYSFNRQTDVAWDPAGNIFISDGYGDARVIKFDKTGRFLKSFGSRGNGPGQMNTPHGIAVDAKGMVYIADRGNARVQVWDNDLNVVKTYDNVGSPWAVCISPGPHQYLYSSNSWPDSQDSRLLASTGEIYKMELDGTIIGRFGKGGKAPKELSTVHAIDCRNPDQLYVAEITGWRVQKLQLHAPQGKTPSGQ